MFDTSKVICYWKLDIQAATLWELSKLRIMKKIIKVQIEQSIGKLIHLSSG